MTKYETKLAVGDEVIYVSAYGQVPSIKKVIHVTPTGRVKIDGVDSVFKGYEILRPIGDSRYGSAREVHLFSEEKLEELQKRNEQVTKAREEKEAKELQRRKENEERYVKELFEAKQACGFNLLHKAPKLVLPDGSRLYTLGVPVKIQHRRLFDILIVRCVDDEEIDWSRRLESDNDRRMKKVVKAYATYASDDKTSFPSCSERTGKDDTEALWACVSNRYNDSW